MHVINTSLARLRLLILTLLLSICHSSWHFPYFFTSSQIHSTGFLSSTCVSANLCPSLISETELISECLLQWHLAVPSSESAPANLRAGKDALHMSPLYPHLPGPPFRLPSSPCLQSEIQQLLSASSVARQKPASFLVALTHPAPPSQLPFQLSTRSTFDILTFLVHLLRLLLTMAYVGAPKGRQSIALLQLQLLL